MRKPRQIQERLQPGARRHAGPLQSGSRLGLGASAMRGGGSQLGNIQINLSGGNIQIDTGSGNVQVRTS